MDTTEEDTSSSSVTTFTSTPPTSKTCKHPNCQKPLFRRTGEAQRSFEKRRYCNATCFKTDPEFRSDRRAAKKAARLAERKNCEICGVEFHRKENEGRPIFNGRPTCSRQCAAEKRSREFQEEVLKHPKTCANPDCPNGGTFYRRLKSETLSKFALRTTCSVACNNAKRKQESKHDWQKKARRPGSSPRKNTGTPISTLPPVNPPSIDIPEAPRRDEEWVWRPQSWGGSYLRKVS